MDVAINRKPLFGFFGKKHKNITNKLVACLDEGETNKAYVINKIDTQDQGMKDFLFTLGCYEGEEVTIISRLADNIVISVKDARYSINSELAKVILI